MGMIGNFLQQPYPQERSTKRLWLHALTFGGFVALFLGIFQPFGLHMDFAYKSWIIGGYGVITAAMIVVFKGFLPTFFPHFFEENRWMVWKEMALLGLLVSTIAILNFVYGSIAHGHGFSLFGLFRFAAMTLLVGVFPVAAGITWRYHRLLQLHLKAAQTVNEQIAMPAPSDAAPLAPTASPTQLVLLDENNKPALELPFDALYYGLAAQNYVELYHKGGKTLLRLSLKALDEQLAAHPQYLRTHRSYLVNLHCIQAVQGNAQGYRLQLHGVAEEIPVSRSRLSAFQAAFEPLQPQAVPSTHP